METRRPDPPPFSLALRRLREQAGWSLRDLAYHAGQLDAGYLSRLEHGWQKRPKPVHWQEAKPSQRALKAIVDALDPEGSGWADELYRLRGVDPPRRVRETQASTQLRGLPAGGGAYGDLPPEDAKAILLDLLDKLEQASRDPGQGHRGRHGDERGGGTAYGAAAG